MKKTKKLLLLLVTLLIFKITSFAQTFNWAKLIGGGSYTQQQYKNSFCVDDNGHIYSVGFFSGTIDVDPGPGVFNLTSSSLSIYVSKLNSSGNFIWAKIIGGGNLSEIIGYSITNDKKRNIYITGGMKGTIDFDPGPGNFNLTSAGGTDVFILKLDSSGSFKWAKRWGGPTSGLGGFTGDIGKCIASDTNNNTYTLYDAINNTSPETHISKLDSAGNIIWDKLIGQGLSVIAGNSLYLDKFGSIYSTGLFNGTIDTDPSSFTYYLTSNGTIDIFVCKLNSNGNFVWAKNIGGQYEDVGYSVCVDSQKNVYVAGSFKDTVDFNPGPSIYKLVSSGYDDAFILKLDSIGNFIWANKIGGPYLGGNTLGDYCYSVAIDPSNNVYATGLFSGTVDFDPGPNTYNLSSSLNSEDIFILKLNSSGNFVWANNFGGGYKDQGNLIKVDASYNIYTSGFFGGTVDFDPSSNISNLTSLNFNITFLQKNSQCISTTSILNKAICNNYVSPSGKYTWVTSGVYNDTIINAAGCDSIILINLVIKKSSDTTISKTVCNNFTSPSGKYLWNTSGIYKDTVTKSNGCDSFITINLTVNKVTDKSTSINGITISANNTLGTYQWLNCINGYSIIPGETNISYTPIANGSYAVKITENNCVDTSLCVTINTLSINNKEIENLITLFPNPSKGIINISSEREFNCPKIIIRNIIGQITYEKDFLSSKLIEIKLELPKGTYLMEIIQKDNKNYFKLLIE
jgi:hypothetical protein